MRENSLRKVNAELYKKIKEYNKLYAETIKFIGKTQHERDLELLKKILKL